MPDQGGNSIVGPGFDYYLGAGHRELEIQAENADTNFAAVQSQAGLGLLGQLTQLLTNPTGGPLGLAASVRYGGPQGIAQGTGGQGIDTSTEYSLYEQMLKSLADFSSTVGAGPEDAPLVEQGARYGGKIKLPSYGDGGTHPVPGPAPVATPGPPAPARAPTDQELDLFGGRALIKAMTKYTTNGGQASDFMNQIKNVVALNKRYEAEGLRLPPTSGFPGLPQPPNPTQWGDFSQDLIRQLLQQYSSVLPFPTLIDPNTENRPGFVHGGGMTLGGAPHYIVDAEGNPVAALTEDGKPEEVKGVGGVEVVPLDPMRNALYESRKQQVNMASAISEAEENLKPTRKVDPNKVPMITPDEAAQVPNVLPGVMANLQIGGFQMLPNNWGPGIPPVVGDPQPPGGSPPVVGDPVTQAPVGNQNVAGGTVGGVYLPTSGGPSQTRQEMIGPRDDMLAEIDGAASIADLLKDLDPGSAEYRSHYAKLLGARLSDTGSEAINVDILRSLNAGKVPNKLISRSAFATMDAGTQSDYTQLLQQMGIIRSPGHLLDAQRKFSPTALS